MIPRETWRGVLHRAGDVFLIVFGAAFAALIIFAAMCLGGGYV